jgi:predicted HicB family RNase H-like nuclease
METDIVVDVEDEVFARLEAKAEREQLSVEEYVRRLVIEATDRPQKGAADSTR